MGSAESIGRRIKGDILNELQLTASVGLAPTKFMAKLASDLNKPDGFMVIAAGAIQVTLDPLPVSRIWGVGRSGERQLKKLGIDTVAQLRAQSEPYLEQKFGQWGQHIWRLANGIDEREVIADADTKSISHETTFDEDIADPDTLFAVLLDLTEQVSHRLRRHQRIASTVQLKIRYADFQTITRACSMPSGTDTTQEIWHTARQLFAKIQKQRPDPLRLLGVGVSGLDTMGSPQVDLFEAQKGKQRELDNVTDSINQRFGPQSVHRGLRLTR